MQNRSTSARTAAQKSSNSSLLLRQAPILAILMLVAVLFSQTAKSQIFEGLGIINDCGTWKASPIVFTDWQSVDTLKKKPIKDTIRKWIYDAEKMQYSTITTLEYSPCGNGRPTIWEQYRVCQITGIRQMRRKIQSYIYIEKPKSEYQSAIDSLSQNSH